MKKRFNREAYFLSTTIIVSFGSCALLSMMLPALKFMSENTVGISYKVDGIYAIFGGEVLIENVEFVFNFNLLSLVSYLLPLFGLVIGILAYKIRSEMFYILSGVISLIGALLILMEPLFFQAINNLANGFIVSIFAGPIIGSISSLIAGFVAIGSGIKLHKDLAI